MSPDLTLDDLLISHAAGRLDEPVALLVATHLALDANSRALYRRYEELGGCLLENVEPEPMDDRSWDAVLARLDAPDEDAALGTRLTPAPVVRSFGHTGVAIPKPLADYLPAPFERLRWQDYGSIAEVDIPILSNGYRTRLIKLRAGSKAPRHTHEGCEITLVLKGAYRDGMGHFRRGEIEINDTSVDHQPVADAGEDCLCLNVNDEPLRLTGTLTRFINPLLRP